ncbi:MAG: hypothetical protein ABWY11_18610 [Umezawaea sp.]
MVVDSAHGVARAVREDVGIRRIPVRADGFGSPELMDEVRSFGATHRYTGAAGECVAGRSPDPVEHSDGALAVTAEPGRGFREGPRDGERGSAGGGLDATGFSRVRQGAVIR